MAAFSFCQWRFAEAEVFLRTGTFFSRICSGIYLCMGRRRRFHSCTRALATPLDLVFFIFSSQGGLAPLIRTN